MIRPSRISRESSCPANPGGLLAPYFAVFVKAKLIIDPLVLPAAGLADYLPLLLILACTLFLRRSEVSSLILQKRINLLWHYILPAALLVGYGFYSVVRPDFGIRSTLFMLQLLLFHGACLPPLCLCWDLLGLSLAVLYCDATTFASSISTICGHGVAMLLAENMFNTKTSVPVTVPPIPFKGVVDRIVAPLIYYRTLSDVLYINEAGARLLAEWKVENLEGLAAQTTVLSSGRPLKDFLDELGQESAQSGDCELVEDCEFRGPSSLPACYSGATKSKLRVSVLRKSGEHETLLFIKKRKALPDAESLQITDSRLRMMLIKALSHELRTPLNIIMNFTDKLEESEKATSQALPIIRQNSKVLLLKTEDMLDFAHILEGEFEVRKSPFDLREFLAELQTTADSLYSSLGEETQPESHLCIGESVPKQVMADRGRLFRVMLHLTLNAHKYAPKGVVEINVKYNYMTQDLEFAINDTGSGINKRKLQALEDFLHSNVLPHELSSGGQELAEMGLGLYITAKICERIGSPLRVNTLEGYGTSFSFRIKQPLRAFSSRMVFAPNRNNTYSPQLGGSNNALRKSSTFKQSEEKRSEEEFKNEECRSRSSRSSRSSFGEVAEESPALNSVVYTKRTATESDERKSSRFETEPSTLSPRSRIRQVMSTFSAKTMPIIRRRSALVVDDNALNRFVLKGMLEKLGLAVEEASNGLHAYQKFEKANYDVVFMDLNMPVMNGIESTEQIRSFEQKHARRRVPIIAVTAFEGSDMVRHCYRIGIDEVLIKPISLDVIRGCSRRYMRVQ